MTRVIPLVTALAALALAPASGFAQTDAGYGARCSDNLVPATPDPAITAAEICATIEVLAADSLEGRQAGTPAGEAAARWIAARFDEIGLAAPEGGRLQAFAFPTRLGRDPHAERQTTDAADAGPETAISHNVIGVLEGSDPALRGEAMVVGAHYDHLGRGASGSLEPGSGEIHNGADDNASGVAGLLELAARFAADPPARTMVWVAFGAEELGNLGSQHWVKTPTWPLEQTVAMLNLDMVGRLRERLTVYGTGTSAAWDPILDSIAAAGPETQRVPDGFGPSDHSSFYGAGIPVIALFTGTHEEYHRPGDDAGTIHADGTVRVLEYAAALIEAVAGSGRALPYAEAPRTQRQAMAFAVGLGVVPDYGFAGEGLAVSSVRGGGPAGRAGLAAGDVIVRLAGREVADVYGYTEILASLVADVPVEVVYRRGDAEMTATVIPEAR